jgi:hypothetical protein
MSKQTEMSLSDGLKVIGVVLYTVIGVSIANNLSFAQTSVNREVAYTQSRIAEKAKLRLITIEQKRIDDGSSFLETKELTTEIATQKSIEREAEQKQAKALSNVDKCFWIGLLVGLTVPVLALVILLPMGSKYD